MWSGGFQFTSQTVILTALACKCKKKIQRSFLRLIAELFCDGKMRYLVWHGVPDIKVKAMYRLVISCHTSPVLFGKLTKTAWTVPLLLYRYLSLYSDKSKVYNFNSDFSLIHSTEWVKSVTTPSRSYLTLLMRQLLEMWKQLTIWLYNVSSTYSNSNPTVAFCDFKKCNIICNFIKEE